jgi:hypothetical protein
LRDPVEPDSLLTGGSAVGAEACPFFMAVRKFCRFISSVVFRAHMFSSVSSSDGDKRHAADTSLRARPSPSRQRVGGEAPLGHGTDLSFRT